jgi:hypothetical protein
MMFTGLEGERGCYLPVKNKEVARLDRAHRHPALNRNNKRKKSSR